MKSDREKYAEQILQDVALRRELSARLGQTLGGDDTLPGDGEARLGEPKERGERPRGRPALLERIPETARERLHLDVGILGLVALQGRPALPVQGTSFTPDNTAYWRQRLAGARPRIDAALPSVGCIIARTDAGNQALGTGWLLTDEVIVTNRHVVRDFLDESAGAPLPLRKVTPTGAQLLGVSLRLDNNIQAAPTAEYAITERLYIDPTYDLAFLRIAAGAAVRPLPLLEQLPAKLKGRVVATIGYPIYSSDLLAREREKVKPEQRPELERVVKELFEKKAGYKMVQPGLVMDVDLDGAEIVRFKHDCSTLGGNSGSAVLDLESGQVLGLHYGSVELAANYALPARIIRERAAALRLL